MAVLLTGGTGKTSLRLAQMLDTASISFVLASRKAEAVAPSGLAAVKFDWFDSSTFDNPFQHQFPNGEKIKAVYLIGPQTMDPSPVVISFIDHAVKQRGVKKFVLLTGSSAEIGGSNIGGAWKHLDDLGIEYTILLATWFMENLSEWQYVRSIKEEDKIYTACADGKIPFIGAKDIAAVAFSALTDDKPHDTAIRVLGPELLTYDDVAATISHAIGREINHVKLSGDEVVARYRKLGMPEQVANFMSYLETSTARGVEERSNNAVEDMTGRPPQKLSDWVQENRTAWL